MDNKKIISDIISELGFFDADEANMHISHVINIEILKGIGLSSEQLLIAEDMYKQELSDLKINMEIELELEKIDYDTIKIKEKHCS
jgi:hypothetical protein